MRSIANVTAERVDFEVMKGGVGGVVEEERRFEGDGDEVVLGGRRRSEFARKKHRVEPRRAGVGCWGPGKVVVLCCCGLGNADARATREYEYRNNQKNERAELHLANYIVV